MIPSAVSRRCRSENPAPTAADRKRISCLSARKSLYLPRSDVYSYIFFRMPRQSSFVIFLGLNCWKNSIRTYLRDLIKFAFIVREGLDVHELAFLISEFQKRISRHGPDLFRRLVSAEFHA